MINLCPVSFHHLFRVLHRIIISCLVSLLSRLFRSMLLALMACPPYLLLALTSISVYNVCSWASRPLSPHLLQYTPVFHTTCSTQWIRILPCSLVLPKTPRPVQRPPNGAKYSFFRESSKDILLISIAHYFSRGRGSLRFLIMRLEFVIHIWAQNLVTILRGK